MSASLPQREEKHLPTDHRIAIFAAVMSLMTVASVTRADPDLWGHVRFGLDVLHSHRLTGVDPYSFTQDRPWLNHEWLSELQMGLAFSAAGPLGLSLLKGALALGSLVVLWSALKGMALEPKIIVVGAVAIGTIGITETLRPQLWSLICLATLCLILVRNTRRARAWLPLLFLVWANLHGGWVVGLGMVAVWGAVDASSKPELRREWAVVIGGCVIATLCTPYGWTLWRFVLQTVQLVRPNIEEWQPLWTLPPHKWTPWLAAVATLIWVVRRPAPYRVHATAVLGMLAYASIRVARIVPLFIPATAILLGPAFIARWPSRASGPARSPRTDRFLSISFFLIAVAGSAWIGSTTLRCVTIDVGRMPEAAAARLLASAMPGRLVTFFDWGEFAIWHFGPRLRVSMDGRRETVYTDRRLSEHDAILFGAAPGFRTLEQWQAEYVWLPASSLATREWLAGHGYRIEFNSPRSFIAVRDDLPRLSVSPGLPAAREGCFPG